MGIWRLKCLRCSCRESLNVGGKKGLFSDSPFLTKNLTFIEPPQLNHPKHIAHILDHNPSDIGRGVDVLFGVIGKMCASDEVEVFEGGVEAFGDAGVEVA